jgi:hypothetical protein
MTQPGGIDIRAALAILSARTPREHRHHHHRHHRRVGESDEEVPSELRRRGQIVNYSPSADTEDDDHRPQSRIGCSAADNNTRARQQSSTATNEDDDDDDDTEGASAMMAGEDTRQRQRQQQQGRVNEMHTQLATMSIPRLINIIFAAQEERVATYRAFEE